MCVRNQGPKHNGLQCGGFKMLMRSRSWGCHPFSFYSAEFHHNHRQRYTLQYQFHGEVTKELKSLGINARIP